MGDVARHINISLPLYDYMPVGNVWPWDVPFQSEHITTIERNGFELTMITMHSETGTRLMLPRMQDQSAPSVDEVDLGELVNRQLRIVDVAVGAEEEISSEAMRRVLTGLADFPRGAALLVRTGWGDERRWEKLGDDYARNTPHFSPGAAEEVCAFLIGNGSRLVLSDVAYYGRGEKYALPLWGRKEAWERHPFPSLPARRFLSQYSRQKSEEDWDSPPVFNRLGVMYVGACCSCGEITDPAPTVTVLPMRLRGLAGAPCTVVVSEA